MSKLTQQQLDRRALAGARKKAEKLGKNHPDYDPKVFYGELEWTRIKSREQFGVSKIITFRIGPDIAQNMAKTEYKVN